MKRVKLKICGMNHNLEEVAALQPDYLGFIFYDKSPRFFEADSAPLPEDTSGVGVFVNARIEEISVKINTYKLDVIQLHGEETPAFCSQLKEKINEKEIWKVFSIKDSFDFSQLKAYESVVDKFLFDTKGKEKGGNGYKFDWSILTSYNSKKPFILSGGIGLEDLAALKNILKTDLPIYAIDVNSKFEISPGLKNTINLKKLQNEL